MKTSLISIQALAVVSLTACIDRSSFESNPVRIQTPKGPVICQLYTRDRVDWDEAISVPDGMTKDEGDAYCLKEGERQYLNSHDRLDSSSS